jgi:hypothetical protein
VRQQLQSLKIIHISPQCGFGFRTTIDEVEYSTRQTPLRAAAQ